MVIHSLAGLPAFAAYFATAVALCILYLVVYTKITPHDEYDLIVHEHNATAAIALGLSLLGFSIPLASAILHSVNILDCVIWGIVALIVQLIAYFLARLAHPHISEAIRQNALASGLWLGLVSVVAGILSAACMSP
jgi:putative membrane protein